MKNYWSRIDPKIDFSWGDGGPVPTEELNGKEIGADYFSARWLGMVQPQYSEVHTFSLVADDGVKLWVDSLLIINFWSRRNLEVEGTIALMAGQLYTIKLEYTESNGNATCILKWRSASQTYEVISSSRLYYSSTSGRLSRTQLYVEPNVLCASTSRAKGTGLTIGTAGVTSFFTIQAFDEYGNMRKMGDSPDFKVRIVPISDAFQKPYHANLNPRWSTAGIERIPSDGVFPGGLTATYYNKYCLGSLAGTTAASCHNLWDKIHSETVVTFVTCMQRPWALQGDQEWNAQSSAVLKNANQAVCGFGMGPDHSPYLSWPASNAGVEIHAQKMTTDYTASSSAREKLFPGTTAKPFSVRWAGYFQPSMGTLHSFKITSPAASIRLVLNEVNKPKETALVATNVAASVKLIANAMYDIEISYSPSAELSASSGPTASLQHSTVDFSSVPYFDNTRPRSSLDVGFGSTGLDDGNSFSARWQGFYLATLAVSTFTVTVGGPDERVRLWIDNRLIIDRWDTFTDVQDFKKSWTATYDVSVPEKTSGEKEALLTCTTTSGVVQSTINVVNAGVGYSMTPTLATSGCNSSSTILAKLVAVMSSGTISSVQVVSGGSGYVCTPSIKILGGRDFVWSSSANSLLDIKLEFKQLGASASIQLQAGSSVIASNLLFRNREIVGSPFPPMSIQPAPTCASKSSVRGAGLSSATAGLPSMFTIQSNDQYINERGIGGDLYVVRLQVGGPSFGCQEIDTCPIVYGTVLDNGDSTYSVTYNITRRGTYNVVTTLAKPGGLTATYYSADFNSVLPLGAGNSQAPDLTLWQPLTGNMITNQATNYGIRLEGFISPPAEKVTFTFLRSGDLGTKRLWFNTHMRTRSESPAAGHGCWLGAPPNLPTCTKEFNGPTIETAFSNGNAIIVSDLAINALYDIKIELGGSTNTEIGVQWQYGATGTFTNAAANIPSSRLWARNDVPNGNVVSTGSDLVTFSTATANVPILGIFTCPTLCLWTKLIPLLVPFREMV